MTNRRIFSVITLFTSLMILMLVNGCKRDIEGLELAEYPINGEVFIDGFTGGLEYAAFDGSDIFAFEVVDDVTYDGSAAAMRFAVPDVGQPEGSYAGGAFFIEGGRNLSEFDVLTFWAKASTNATIDVVGFGIDLDENKHTASMSAEVNTNWKKFIIPIPDAAKLNPEKGLFYYSEGPEDGNGYTFWIDEVQFETLGTITNPRPSIQDGQDATVMTETGNVVTVSGLTETFNMPNGLDQMVNVSPAFFTFTSSSPAVATVSDIGEVTMLSTGTSIITASIGGVEALGSLTVTSTGTAVFPTVAAPNPTEDAADVISLFSNVYNNVNVDLWNTFWEFSTAETFDIQVDGNDVKRYTNLNFVGIEFTSQTIDATSMTHFHMDIWTPDPTDLPAAFKVLLVDFGANNTFDGGDDSSHELTFTSPLLQTGSWVSLDIPLSNFVGLTSTSNLAQLVLSGDLPNVFVDNVYFYAGDPVNPGTPSTSAPNPTEPAANVTSIFSDAYTNVAGTDFYPNWGQVTTPSEVSIAGNNTLLYSGLDYQGVQLASSIDVSAMTHLHMDVWTANSTMLNTFLISDGPVETAFALSVPTSGWSSVDIPLSAFSPVDLADIIQMKFDGNGDIFLDNIYFYTDGGTGGTGPSSAAPTPTQAAANVMSIFSDAYSPAVASNLNPGWGQSTVQSEVMIAGNNTMLYTGLNYQGIEFANSINVSGMTHLHIDVWTDNSSALNAFIISPGPVETPYVVSVPTSGWLSLDIPLTNFSPVDLADVFQMKFDGNGDIYLDNIYFYN